MYYLDLTEETDNHLDCHSAISQVLSQKHSLETNIAELKNSGDRNVEAYNVQELIIIGKIDNLTETSQKRSFELFRNNLKNIRIITYDECLEQLKSIIEYLSEKSNLKSK